MSVEKIVKTTYKVELTEGAYSNIVKVLQYAGMYDELKELGVNTSEDKKVFINPARCGKLCNKKSVEDEIRKRNAKLGYIPTMADANKEEIDRVFRAMIEKSGVPAHLFGNGIHVMVDGGVAYAVLANHDLGCPGKEFDLIKKSEGYSNPFKLDNFTLVHGKSKKGETFGAVSIAQSDKDIQSEIVSQIHLNHYNSIQLVKVLESMVEDSKTANTNRIARFSIDNTGNALSINKENNDNIVTVIYEVASNTIVLRKKDNAMIFSTKQAQEVINFIKYHKEMN